MLPLEKSGRGQLASRVNVRGHRRGGADHGRHRHRAQADQFRGPHRRLLRQNENALTRESPGWRSRPRTGTAGFPAPARRRTRRFRAPAWNCWSRPAPPRRPSSSTPMTASQNAWNSIDIRDNPPLEVRANGRCSVISPLATARDTVHCTDIAAIIAPSIWPDLDRDAQPVSATKCTSETTNDAMIGKRQDLVGNSDVGKGDDRHPDQIEDGDQHAEAFGAEPVQPAQREFAPLIRRQPAGARQETPPVLLDDLESAIGPAVALLLEGLDRCPAAGRGRSGCWCSG